MICHSSGCSIPLDFSKNLPEFSNAYYFSDPVYGPETPDNQLVTTKSQRTITHSTGLCSTCCASDFDFANRTFSWYGDEGLDIYSELEDLGHCSILNYLEGEFCRVS